VLTGALRFRVAGHVPLADEAAVPVEGAMATLAVECLTVIGNWRLKLGTAMAAEMPQF